MAIAHLRTRDPRWDMRSYVAIHILAGLRRRRADHRVDLGEGRLGHWWVWDEPTLVSPADHAALRDLPADAVRNRGPERQARAARCSRSRQRLRPDQLRDRPALHRLRPSAHARQLSGNLPGRMQVVFWLALASVALLWITLWRYEMASKHATAQLRRCGGCSPVTSPKRPPAQRRAERDHEPGRRWLMPRCRSTPPAPMSPRPTSCSSR